MKTFDLKKLEQYRQLSKEISDWKIEHSGARVFVRHPRFTGLGVMVLDGDAREDNVAVRLPNGHVWWYPIDTVILDYPECPQCGLKIVGDKRPRVCPACGIHSQDWPDPLPTHLPEEPVQESKTLPVILLIGIAILFLFTAATILMQSIKK